LNFSAEIKSETNCKGSFGKPDPTPEKKASYKLEVTAAAT